MPTPRAWVDSLTFSDGSQFSFAKTDIVIVVGPNNSGKSAALRAIRDKIGNSPTSSPVVSAISVGRSGTTDDVDEWLASFAHIPDQDAVDPVFQAFGVGVHRSHLSQLWPGTKNSLATLARYFFLLLTAEERLVAANSVDSIDALKSPPTHPLHVLYRRAALEEQLSRLFRRAFGEDLIVNRFAGRKLHLHVGQRPAVPAGTQPWEEPYLKALNRLPLLQAQGDGMRSFAGVLLATSVGSESIICIDEPEAFLHPPQARLLGRTLVSDKPALRQLFVATHSGDILRGVLDAGSTHVRVVRISRSGDVNQVRLLDNAKIAALWNDPLLRYSNILDGLFHQRVVVCESDGDARFYSAMTDAEAENRGPDFHRPDIMFTHCGGKDRLLTVVRALREVDVPVTAIADFDILRDEQPLRDLAECFGVRWPTIEADWHLIQATIASKKPERSPSEVSDDIKALLKQVPKDTFPDQIRRDISRLLKTSTPWASAKVIGRAFLPAGQPTQAFDRLSVTLRDAGLAIVPKGEMECFDKTIAWHGPRWVNEVLKKDLRASPELSDARDFVAPLLR